MITITVTIAVCFILTAILLYKTFTELYDIDKSSLKKLYISIIVISLACMYR